MANSRGKWAIPCERCGRRIEWIGEFSARPQCACKAPANLPSVSVPKPSSIRVSRKPQADDSAAEAFELCDEIESLACDVPSRGQEYAESVAEKSESIRASVEASGRASAGQISALENMRDGLLRWVR